MAEASQMAALIHEEHDITLALLNSLERATGKKHKDTPMDLCTAEGKATLEAVVRTCDNDVKRHFEFEEMRLFPHILLQGGGCMVNILTAEHAQIRPIALELRDLAEGALAAGAFEKPQWAQFCQLANDLVDIETFHIQKEEMGLIGALQAMFSAEEDAALAVAYRAIGQP